MDLYIKSIPAIFIMILHIDYLKLLQPYAKIKISIFHRIAKYSKRFIKQYQEHKNIKRWPQV